MDVMDVDRTLVKRVLKFYLFPSAEGVKFLLSLDVQFLVGIGDRVKGDGKWVGLSGR